MALTLYSMTQNYNTADTNKLAAARELSTMQSSGASQQQVQVAQAKYNAYDAEKSYWSLQIDSQKSTSNISATQITAAKSKYDSALSTYQSLQTALSTPKTVTTPTSKPVTSTPVTTVTKVTTTPTVTTPTVQTATKTDTTQSSVTVVKSKFGVTFIDPNKKVDIYVPFTGSTVKSVTSTTGTKYIDTSRGIDIFVPFSIYDPRTPVTTTPTSTPTKASAITVSNSPVVAPVGITTPTLTTTPVKTTPTTTTSTTTSHEQFLAKQASQQEALKSTFVSGTSKTTTTTVKAEVVAADATKLAAAKNLASLQISGASSSDIAAAKTELAKATETKAIAVGKLDSVNQTVSSPTSTTPLSQLTTSQVSSLKSQGYVEATMDNVTVLTKPTQSYSDRVQSDALNAGFGTRIVTPTTLAGDLAASKKSSTSSSYVYDGRDLAQNEELISGKLYVDGKLVTSESEVTSGMRTGVTYDGRDLLQNEEVISGKIYRDGKPITEETVTRTQTFADGSALTTKTTIPKVEEVKSPYSLGDNKYEKSLSGYEKMTTEGVSALDVALGAGIVGGFVSGVVEGVVTAPSSLIRLGAGAVHQGVEQTGADMINGMVELAKTDPARLAGNIAGGLILAEAGSIAGKVGSKLKSGATGVADVINSTKSTVTTKVTSVLDNIKPTKSTPTTAQLFSDSLKNKTPTKTTIRAPSNDILPTKTVASSESLADTFKAATSPDRAPIKSDIITPTKLSSDIYTPTKVETSPTVTPTKASSIFDDVSKASYSIESNIDNLIGDKVKFVDAEPQRSFTPRDSTINIPDGTNDIGIKSNVNESGKPTEMSIPDDRPFVQSTKTGGILRVSGDSANTHSSVPIDVGNKLMDTSDFSKLTGREYKASDIPDFANDVMDTSDFSKLTKNKSVSELPDFANKKMSSQDYQTITGTDYVAKDVPVTEGNKLMDASDFSKLKGDEYIRTDVPLTEGNKLMDASDWEKLTGKSYKANDVPSTSSNKLMDASDFDELLKSIKSDKNGVVKPSKSVIDNTGKKTSETMRLDNDGMSTTDYTLDILPEGAELKKMTSAEKLEQLGRTGDLLDKPEIFTGDTKFGSNSAKKSTKRKNYSPEDDADLTEYFKEDDVSTEKVDSIVDKDVGGDIKSESVDIQKVDIKPKKVDTSSRLDFDTLMSNTSPELDRLATNKSPELDSLFRGNTNKGLDDLFRGNTNKDLDNLFTGKGTPATNPSRSSITDWKPNKVDSVPKMENIIDATNDVVRIGKKKSTPFKTPKSMVDDAKSKGTSLDTSNGLLLEQKAKTTPAKAKSKLKTKDMEGSIGTTLKFDTLSETLDKTVSRTSTTSIASIGEVTKGLQKPTTKPTATQKEDVILKTFETTQQTTSPKQSEKLITVPTVKQSPKQTVSPQQTVRQTVSPKQTTKQTVVPQQTVKQSPLQVPKQTVSEDTAQTQTSPNITKPDIFRHRWNTKAASVPNPDISKRSSTKKRKVSEKVKKAKIINTYNNPMKIKGGKI